MADIRECRLRPEYDHLYDAVPAGVWRRAREVAELLVARASEVRRLSLQERTFDARHFEFRGGTAGARPPSWRTRASDKPSAPSTEIDPGA
jgi:hypothetical protein